MSEASVIPVPHLRLPSVTKRAPWQDSEERRVSNWLTAWDFKEPIAAGLIGAPYSGASFRHLERPADRKRCGWRFDST